MLKQQLNAQLGGGYNNMPPQQQQSFAAVQAVGDGNNTQQRTKTSFAQYAAKEPPKTDKKKAQEFSYNELSDLRKQLMGMGIPNFVPGGMGEKIRPDSPTNKKGAIRFLACP